ncbi:biopolymer transporter ExbD [Dinoroseobacter shibae]|jgi:biopolymer transport protein ExbD|nr:biopolymer transporter ExbD [Dinoroseobacter shibae]URF52810.1 biopolymer transporter ExbD [Dinoroseobacter shibae]
MIDVVFLLLVFFMLAARFGSDTGLSLTLAGGNSGAYSGPPRVIDVLPEGQRLNGVALDEDALRATLADLTASPDDLIILRSRDDAVLQRLVDLVATLEAAGYTRFAILE